MPKDKKIIRKPRRKIVVPKDCYFCVEKKEPSYTDVETLHRFITERGKIVGKARSGICLKHQRGVTTAIKHARHLALLSFVG